MINKPKHKKIRNGFIFKKPINNLFKTVNDKKHARIKNEKNK